MYCLVDTEKFFVTWQLLEHPDKKASASPEAREMHSTCCQYGNMLIIGGRNERGEILSDVWVLRFLKSSSSIQLRAGNGDAGQQTPAVCTASEDKNKDEGTLIDPDLTSAARLRDSSELAEVLSESESNGVQCGAAISSSVGGIDFTGHIQELDLSASEQKWQKTEAPSTAPAPTASLPNLQRNQLFWTMLDNLTLPVGRCAHSAAVSEGDVFVCGGFSEGGITDIVLKRALSPPLTPSPALRSGNTSNLKSSNSTAIYGAKDEDEEEQRGTVWCPITLETATPTPSVLPTTIGGRFGHAMCAVSAPLLSHIHKTVQSSSSKRGSGPKEASEDDPDKLNPISGSSFLIFGGVSAERDFGDIWLVTGASRDSNS
jgi:hypothetical protein